MSTTPPISRFAFWFCLTAVAVLSLAPTDFLPPPVFSLWDKAQHALGFAGLTVLGLRAYPHRTGVLIGGLLFYGGAIELTQEATGWRQGDWLDLLADVIGIAAGAALIRLMGPRR